jgi:transcription initiation factor TFIIB
MSIEEDDQFVEHNIRCRECGSRNLETDTTRGEVSCLDCGLVLEENKIDPGAEWRSFSPEHGDNMSRTGAPVTQLIHDKGLSTDIDWQNRDYSGRALSSKSRVQYHRMRKWQRRARVSNTHDRNLATALPEIARISSKLGMSKGVQQEVAVVYRKSMEKGLTRGRSIDALVSASIYLVCNINKLGRTLDEVADASRVGRKELTRCYKIIKKELGVRIRVNHPRDFIQGFVSKLGLPPETLLKTSEIIDEAEKKELIDGKSPTGIAAAAIYIASHLTGRIRTQREVADVSSVTEVTIRNRYKELASALDIEINQK